MAAPEQLGRRRAGLVAPLLSSGVLTLLIAAPWLQPGYLFGTDWPGPRRLEFPSTVSSTAGVQLLWAETAQVFGAQLAVKLFVVAVLFAAGATAYRAVPRGGVVAGTVAAAIYVLNPFVYGRLHYGQVLVVAGYAVLPWVAMRWRLLFVRPSPWNGVLAGVSVALVGLLSIHMLLAGAVLIVILAAAHLATAPKTAAYWRELVPAVLVAGALGVAANLYWVRPALSGQGDVGAVLANIGPADLKAYAAVADPQLGLVPNLLGLYGFWAEGIDRFTSMKDFVPLWPVALAGLLALSGLGLVAAVRARKDQLGAWAVALACTALVALVLEMGVSHTATAGLARWLDANVVPFRGMRDSGKWAALIALAYSQLGGLGAAAAVDWVRTRVDARPSWRWVAGVTAGVVLALPVFYGNGLLYGSHGEIQPSDYPRGWYQADAILMADPHPHRTLFLPWHEYMAFSFIRNENKVVASPVPAFFSRPVLVSANPEVPGIAPPADRDQTAVTGLVSGGGTQQWAGVLVTIGVKYVLLAREVNWYDYTYLDHEPNLLKEADFGSIVVYRNALVPD